MSDYSETELLELAKDILAKPGAMSEQDVLELDEIGRRLKTKGGLRNEEAQKRDDYKTRSGN